MKLKNLKVGVRVQYKGNLTGILYEGSIPVGCLGTVIIVDGTSAPLVRWDCSPTKWVHVGNLKKVK